MPLPALGSYGSLIYERTSPLASKDEANGFAWAILCGALGAMKDEAHGLISDSPEGPGWSALLDVDRIPARWLPYLAQFVGERVPAGEPEADARQRVRVPRGMLRGTLQAITEAPKPTLTGGQFVLVLERTSSAYTLTVVTLTSETPDPALTNARLQAAKPVGLILTHIVTNVTIVDALVGDVDSLVGNVDAL